MVVRFRGNLQKLLLIGTLVEHRGCTDFQISQMITLRNLTKIYKSCIKKKKTKTTAKECLTEKDQRGPRKIKVSFYSSQHSLSPKSQEPPTWNYKTQMDIFLICCWSHKHSLINKSKPSKVSSITITSITIIKNNTDYLA